MAAKFSVTFNPSLSLPCGYCSRGQRDRAIFLLDIQRIRPNTNSQSKKGGGGGTTLRRRALVCNLVGGVRSRAQIRGMFSFSFVTKTRGLDRVPVARGRARGGSESDGDAHGRRGSGSESQQRSRRGSAASLSGSMPPNLSLSAILALKKRSKMWTKSE